MCRSPNFTVLGSSIYVFVVSVVIFAEGSVAGATKLALEEGISPVIAIQKNKHCAVISFVVIIVSVLSTTVVWDFWPEQGG